MTKTDAQEFAKFLNWKQTSKRGSGMFRNEADSHLNFAPFSIRGNEMKFDTDWNWLMGIVEIIESKGFKVAISPYPRIERSHLANLHVMHFKKWQFKGESMIERTYTMFKEFIVEFNKYEPK